MSDAELRSFSPNLFESFNSRAEANSLDCDFALVSRALVVINLDPGIVLYAELPFSNTFIVF